MGRELRTGVPAADSPSKLFRHRCITSSQMCHIFGTDVPHLRARAAPAVARLAISRMIIGACCQRPSCSVSPAEQPGRWQRDALDAHKNNGGLPFSSYASWPRSASTCLPPARSTCRPPRRCFSCRERHLPSGHLGRSADMHDTPLSTLRHHGSLPADATESLWHANRARQPAMISEVCARKAARAAHQTTAQRRAARAKPAEA